MNLSQVRDTAAEVMREGVEEKDCRDFAKGYLTAAFHCGIIVSREYNAAMSALKGINTPLDWWKK